MAAWWVPDLQSGGCRFESRPGLLCTKVYSAFHPSGLGKWVPVIAGKAKAGMAHSDCGWTCGCAGKTVKSFENTCHTWALLRWCFTTKRRYIKCMHLTFSAVHLCMHVCWSPERLRTFCQWMWLSYRIMYLIHILMYSRPYLGSALGVQAPQKISNDSYVFPNIIAVYLRNGTR